MSAQSTTDTIMDEVVKQDAQYMRAGFQADTGALESMMSDDYIFISGLGRITNKETHIASLKSGVLKYTTLASGRDISVRLYGDTAILISSVMAEGEFKGEDKIHDISGLYLATRVYVKQSGHWVIVSVQATRSAQ